MTDFIIRRAVVSDCNAMSVLETECFSEPWSENALKEAVKKEDNIYFCAVCDGNIVGYIGSYVVLGEVYINNIAVTRSYRHNGIGKALLNSLTEYCKSNLCEFVTLEVRKSNINAIKLYEKCGFSFVGERKNFYSNPKENALLYTKFFGD